MAWHALRCADDFVITFQRTLRVPDDGRRYPLPPGLGTFPIERASDYRARLPAAVRATADVFIPMYQREALWLGFHAKAGAPHAVKIAVGGFNALTGAAHQPALHAAPQDYLVSPPQHWLDGVRTERGTVRQFVAVPLGLDQTLEAALSGAEVQGGLQVLVCPALPDRIPSPTAAAAKGPQRALGFAAGGAIEQKIYPDPYGLEVWDQARAEALEVQVLNAREYADVTGRPPPPSPLDASIYSAHGLPWFTLYDRELADLEAAPRLAEAADVSSERQAGERTDPPLGELHVSELGRPARGAR